MKLSKRLNNIALLIEKNNVIADIGCDHGKILLYVLKNNLANFVYGSDISPKSVNKTSILLAENNFNNFKTLTSDGFSAYSTKELSEINSFIIAGMGGQEIIKILKTVVSNENFAQLKSFIIQPQNNAIQVREFLNSFNLPIELDFIIEEKNKFYNIIKINLERKFKKLTKNEIMFGKSNFKNNNQDFVKYLIYEQQKSLEIINNTNGKIKKQFKRYFKKLKNIQKKISL